MTPEQIRAARNKLDLSLADFALMLGFQSSKNANLRNMSHALELPQENKKHRPLREPQRRLLEAYLNGYRPPDWPE